MRCLLLLPISIWCVACIFPERELDGLACSPDQRCGDGYSCRDGTCVADGTDAAGLLGDHWIDDTAAPDHATADTAIDAGRADATAPDTGARDSEADDASPLPDTGSAPDLEATPDVSVEPDAEHDDVPSPPDRVNTDATSPPDVLGVVDAATPRDAGDDDPSDDLVVAFSFSEGSGTTTHDAVGGMTGTITGATWTVDGEAGDALSFNVDGLVTLAPASTLQALASGTFCLWMKRTGGGSTNILSAVNAGQDPRLYMTIVQNKLVVMYETWQGGGHSAVFQTETPYPADGLWHHVAYSSQAGVGNALFLDGVMVTPDVIVGEASDSFFLSAPGAGTSFTLGAQLVGALDEVRVYDRSLTQAEVQFDMSYVPL